MDIWKSKRWEKIDNSNLGKKGLYFRVENQVDPEVRRACLEFAEWIRRKYFFPIRVIVYVKSSFFIKSLDGELVYGTFWRPAHRTSFPYIKVSTGDYVEIMKKRGKDNALAAILSCVAEMLTYYFQWLNGMEELTEEEEVLYAESYSQKIMIEYAKTRDHP